MSKFSSQDSDSSKNGSRVNSESNTNEEYAKGDGKLGFSNHPAQLYKILPPQIRRRIKALKKLQVESVRIEAEFFAEVHKLECKYNQLYSGIYQKRRAFVTGETEPNDQDCDFTLDASLDGVAEGGNEQGFSPFGAVDANTKGIPYFWLTIFKNVDLLNDMVEPHDEPVLKHLTDIEVEFLENDPMGFVLKFVFSPNEFFSNPVLTKYYEMRCKPDEEDPFSFEGPEIIKCKGCTIDWYKNKNVTKKTVKKRQKHKTQGTVRTVSKTVKNDSFFNFFDPPQVSDDENEDVDAEIQAILTSDFEIGHYIRERIVPHAVLYFTGEALEEEEDLEEEEEEDDDELSEDSDENESVVLCKDSKNNQQAPECKQQ
uniref:Nucleosome assembly protein 1-like 4 n=1 Tax=Lygus hesperus TaxID=30085 RepID=A0A0A9YAS1_LYGHE